MLKNSNAPTLGPVSAKKEDHMDTLTSHISMDIAPNFGTNFSKRIVPAAVINDSVLASSLPNDDWNNFWIIIGATLLIAIVIVILSFVFAIWRRSRNARNIYNFPHEKQIVNIKHGKLPCSYSTKRFCFTSSPALYSSTEDSEVLSPDLVRHNSIGGDIVGSHSPSGAGVHGQSRQRHGSIQSLTSNHQLMCSPPPSDIYRSSDEEDAGQISPTAGKIWFSVCFNSLEKKLTVHIIKARYLKGRGMTQEPRDPFVRVFLLPDESNFYQSKVRKKTLAPRFNETFCFEVSSDELPNRTLQLSVYDIDKRNVRHTLGHALVSLNKIDTLGNTVVMWRSLEAVSQKLSQHGELQCSLCCNPYTERMKITVMRARNLPIKAFPKDQTEMYVKVELYIGQKMVKSKETPGQRMSENPAFLQSFSFCITGKHFETCSLAVLVMIRPLGSANGKCQALGKMVVGPFMFARGDELQHWQEMIANPRTPIERWHSLEEVTLH